MNNKKVKFGVSDFIFKDNKGNVILEIKEVNNEKDIYNCTGEHLIEFENVLDIEPLREYFQINSEAIVERIQIFYDSLTGEKENDLLVFKVGINSIKTISRTEECSFYRVLMNVLCDKIRY
jgi:hypothetical protein